jgi:hypothetical protein
MLISAHQFLIFDCRFEIVGEEHIVAFRVFVLAFVFSTLGILAEGPEHSRRGTSSHFGHFF